MTRLTLCSFGDGLDQDEFCGHPTVRGEAVPKSDFAPWLKNNSSRDEALTELKQFAEASRAEWPYHSNRMADYVRVILNAHDPKEDQLLISWHLPGAPVA